MSKQLEGNPVKIIGIKMEESPVLYSKIEKIASTYHINKVRVKIDNKSKDINAGASSFPYDRVVFTKKLLNVMNEDELEGVVAHEFSHIYNNDFYMSFGILLVFLVPTLIILLITYLLGLMLTSNPNMDVSLKIILFTIYLFLFLLSFAILFYGSKIANSAALKIEIRSDIEAVLRTGNPNALKNALMKMYLSFFEYDKRPGIISKIKEGMGYIKIYYIGYNHPHTKERIEYLEFAEKVLNLQKEEISKPILPLIREK